MLPFVSLEDIRVVDVRDAVESTEDPMHKQWYGTFLLRNPHIAREVLKKAHDYSCGDPIQQDKMLKLVSYTIACFEVAAEGNTQPEDAGR